MGGGRTPSRWRGSRTPPLTPSKVEQATRRGGDQRVRWDRAGPREPRGVASSGLGARRRPRQSAARQPITPVLRPQRRPRPAAAVTCLRRARGRRAVRHHAADRRLRDRQHRRDATRQIERAIKVVSRPPACRRRADRPRGIAGSPPRGAFGPRRPPPGPHHPGPPDPPISSSPADRLTPDQDGALLSVAGLPAKLDLVGASPGRGFGSVNDASPRAQRRRAGES